MASFEDQLARVVAGPDEDAERLAYAELLRGHDDVRAELIRLQLLATPTDRQGRRIKELIDNHASRLLGPMRGLVSRQSLEFSRGFVSACIVGSDSLAQLARCPEAAVIENLRIGGPATRQLELGPLDALPNLRRLDLRHKAATDLQPLARCTKLRSLNLASTRIADLSPLRSLAQLEELNLARTLVSDLETLRGLPGLKKLVIAKTAVSNLEPLSGLTKLQVLHAADTRVADLCPVASLAQLERLHVGFSQVATLEPLCNLVSLTALSAPRTQVTDLAPLAGLAALRHLGLSHTAVADLRPLSALEDLEAIYLVATLVWGAQALAHLPALKEVHLWRTKHLKDEVKRLRESVPTAKAVFDRPALSIPNPDFQRWLRGGWTSMTDKEFLRTCWSAERS